MADVTIAKLEEAGFVVGSLRSDNLVSVARRGCSKRCVWLDVAGARVISDPSDHGNALLDDVLTALNDPRVTR